MKPFVFLRAYPPATAPPGPALWLLFYKGEVLVTQTDASGALTLPRGTRGALDSLELSAPLYLGTLDGVPCLAAEVDAGCDLPEGWAAANLRGLFGKVSDAEYSLAGYASQVLYWRRTSVFCPVCGHRTEAERGRLGPEVP